MINLIKADIYKIFKMKSFYICGILAGLFSLFLVYSTHMYMQSQYPGIDVSLFGFNATYGLTYGLTCVTIFAIIFISMYSASEFSFGTIKNFPSSGLNKIKVYISRLITTWLITIIFVLFCAIVSFSAGGIFWGVDNIDRTMFLEILKMLGLFIFAQITVQSIVYMIGCFIKGTGGTVATSLVILFLSSSIFKGIDNLVNKWLAPMVKDWVDISNFSISNYTPLMYMSTYNSMNIPKDDIITGCIVCGSYLLVSVLLGMYFFKKRDIL